MQALCLMPLDPIFYATPLFFVLIGIELWYSSREKLELYEWKDSIANLAMAAGTGIIGMGGRALAFLLFTFLFQFRVFDIGWSWWAWLILLFADDLSYYVYHRVHHEVRFFWAAHVNHHSSQKYNLSVALRQTWVGALTMYIFWLWLPLLGFPPMMILIMMSINLIYQYWIHTETIGRLPVWFELIFNTPSHHRVHHGSNIRYLDRNHAGIFIIWDRFFGTFQKEDPGEKVVYGLTENIHTYNPLKIAFHEFISIGKDLRQKGLSFRQRWMYVFGPPGWSHDGSRKSSRQLRQEKAKGQRV